MFVIKPGEYQLVPALISSLLPEFVESPEFARRHPADRKLPGVVCGALADFLQRNQAAALTDASKKGVLDRAYATIERLASSTDAEVQNLVVVEIFENFDCDRVVMEEIRRRLLPASLNLYETWIENRGH